MTFENLVFLGIQFLLDVVNGIINHKQFVVFMIGVVCKKLFGSNLITVFPHFQSQHSFFLFLHVFLTLSMNRTVTSSL